MTASGDTDNLEDKALRAMTEPKRRKAADFPPYRHTAERLADLEERDTHLKVWEGIEQRRQLSLQDRVAGLEVQVAHLLAANEALTERLAALEHPKGKSAPDSL